MTADNRYWSIEACGWVSAPAVGQDALATPWSGADLPLPGSRPHPRDADDLLRTRSRSGALPGQRTTDPTRRAAGPARPAAPPGGRR
ncbi:MAG TPA: hypothetical protein VM433_07455 [Mycobacteriales bacterium]|nr:hypothetical protein [Mycobacteriales bacterium]